MERSVKGGRGTGRSAPGISPSVAIALNDLSRGFPAVKRSLSRRPLKLQVLGDVEVGNLRSTLQKLPMSASLSCCSQSPSLDQVGELQVQIELYNSSFQQLFSSL